MKKLLRYLHLLPKQKLQSANEFCFDDFCLKLAQKTRKK